MSSKNRLLDFKLSGWPEELGICAGDTLSCSRIVNRATQSLLFSPESNDSGMWGAWAEMAFEVERCTNPYIVTPRNTARLEAMDVCKWPVPIHNQFFEYLRFGNGKFPKCDFGVANGGCATGIAAFERGTVPSFVELRPPNKIIRVYVGDASDVNKRTLIQGRDNNGQTLYSTDNAVLVEGIFLTLEAPFVDMPIEMSKLTGLQKDNTNAPVRYFEVDTVTGDSRMIAALEPTETVACYRKYYLNNLPKNCCPADPASNTVQVTAIAKLDYIPVYGDTDYLLVSNLEALGNECQSLRYLGTDTGNGKQMSEFHHKKAIGLLNGELIHREGKLNPSVSFSPFGTARLAYLGFGQMK